MTASDDDYMNDPEIVQDDAPKWVEVPLDRLDPQTLNNLISEFVTRQWDDFGEASYTVEQKIRQIRNQLKSSTAKVVFDFATNTCNILRSDDRRLTSISSKTTAS